MESGGGFFTNDELAGLRKVHDQDTGASVTAYALEKGKKRAWAFAPEVGKMLGRIDGVSEDGGVRL
jgi:hypothetical protein